MAAAAAEAADGRAGVRGQRLTTEQRWAIVSMHKDARSNRCIARKLGVHRNTVRDVLARFAAVGQQGCGQHGAIAGAHRGRVGGDA